MTMHASIQPCYSNVYLYVKLALEKKHLPSYCLDATGIAVAVLHN